jgi:hypothetical protein
MAYGDSPFLNACLASLRTQARGGHILVATSTPSPFIDAAAGAYGARLVVNPRRAGIGADRNFDHAASPARLVTLAHQDDLYYPAFLKRTLELFAAAPRASLAFSGYRQIDDRGAPAGSRISFVKHALEAAVLGARTEIRGARLRAFLSLGNPLPCSAVTFDTERLGDFAFSTELRSNLDWDAWLRLGEAGHVFARTPERLVGRRHNPLTATSGLIRSGVRQAEDAAMFRRLWPAPLAAAIAWLYRAAY